MSDRKRPRLGRCLMCQQPAVIARHSKCIQCRVAMMLKRFARRAELKAKKQCKNTSNE